MSDASRPGRGPDGSGRVLPLGEVPSSALGVLAVARAGVSLAARTREVVRATTERARGVVVPLGVARASGVALVVTAAVWAGRGEVSRGAAVSTVMAMAQRLAAAAEAALVRELRPEMVWLPGGTFEMGSPEDEGSADERPRHAVTVSGFAIARTEVTVAHYEAVMGGRPSDSDFGCADTRPVQNVSWEDAVRYANRLTELENEVRTEGPRLTRCYEEGTWAWDRECTGYRLPTEAEWEYAARAGSRGRWSFGEDEKELCKYGNVMDKSGRSFSTGEDDSIAPCDDGFKDLAPVGSYRANEWGLYDMHGNVWEWVYDWYDEDFYGRDESEVTNPVNMMTGARVGRVLRGGSFSLWPVDTRSAYRDWNRPTVQNRNYGLRVVRGRAPSMAP